MLALAVLLAPLGLAEEAGSEDIEIFDLNNKIRIMLPEGYGFQGRFSDTNNGTTVTAKVYATTAAAYPAKISFTDTGWMTNNFNEIIAYFRGLYGIERFTFEKGAVGDVSTALGIVYRPGGLCDVIFAYLPGGYEQTEYRMIYARDLNKTQVNGFLEILDGIVPIEPGKCGENISWSLSEKGVLHLEGSGDMYEYAKSPWDAELVRSAVVDEGITSLSPYVFQNAVNMTEVSLPSTITAIPDFAFHLCYSLEAIDFHPGIKTIGMYAFSACKAIAELDFPSAIEDIGLGAFWGCANLVRVRFSEGLKVLGGCTFQNCRKLVDVTLPSTLESLCAQAFYDCRGLRTIKLLSPMLSTTAPGQS